MQLVRDELLFNIIKFTFCVIFGVKCYLVHAFLTNKRYNKNNLFSFLSRTRKIVVLVNVKKKIYNTVLVFFNKMDALNVMVLTYFN